jgi:hypothetical protein
MATQQQVRRTPAQPPQRPGQAPSRPAPQVESPTEDEEEVEDPFAAEDQVFSQDGGGLDEPLNMEDVEERAGRELIPSGVYDCYVESAEAGFSKAGNAMITWRLQAQLPDGGSYLVFLHTTNSEKDQPRLKAYVNIAAPGEVDWKTETLRQIADKLPGKWVRAKLRVQKSQDYDDSMAVSSLLPYQGA